MSALAHGTMVMERTYNASPTRVFNAWGDIDARTRWSAPTPADQIVYEAQDFREGGLDISHCGRDGELDYTARVTYLTIEAHALIVFTETVSYRGERKSHAQISVELFPAGSGTRLLLTMQIASFDGPGMIAGYDEGWTAALDNLASEF